MAQPREITQQREERAWLLRQKGWTQERIAEDLGVSQMAVSKILSRVAARLASEFRDRAEEIKAEQTARLEYLYSEALTHLEGAEGANPALLNQARGALSDIRTIWGLDAPKKQDLTTAGQPFKVYGGFDPEQV